MSERKRRKKGEAGLEEPQPSKPVQVAQGIVKGVSEQLKPQVVYRTFRDKWRSEFRFYTRLERLMLSALYLVPALAVLAGWAWLVNKIVLFALGDLVVIPVYFSALGVIAGILLALLAEVVGVLQPPYPPRASAFNVLYMIRYAFYLVLGYYLAPLVTLPFVSYFAIYLYAYLAQLIWNSVGIIAWDFIAFGLFGAGIFATLIVIMFGFIFIWLVSGVVVALVSSVSLVRSAFELFKAYYIKPLILAFLLRLAFRVGPLIGLNPAFWAGFVLVMLTLYAGIQAALGDWRDMNKIPGYLALYAVASGYVPIELASPALPIMQFVANLFNTPGAQVAYYLWELLLTHF